MKEYLDISDKKAGGTTLLSNGDFIYLGGEGTIFQGQWFYYHKVSKYTCRLPKATTREEALEEYQTQTGNCIV
jgi:hypothetical protein